MARASILLTIVLFACSVLASTSQAQLDGRYEFDAGGDGTSWDDATNWERVTDSNGLPVSGNPIAPPNPLTTADIPLGGVVIDGTMPGQTALDLNIGTSSGSGSLAMSGGDLTVRDVFVGSDAGGANAGNLVVSGGSLTAGDDIVLSAGSAGQMTISGGFVSTADDFVMDLGSSLVMTGGTLDVGDRLQTLENANIMIDGATVLARDDIQFFGDAQVSVNSGLLAVVDKLYFDVDPTRNGKLTLNGGIARSEEYGLAGDGLGLIEINGSGAFQVLQSQLSIADALMLIAAGIHITTSEPASLFLTASSVVVPDFFGQSDLTFTQISIVPEPTTGLMIMLGLMGLARQTRTQAASSPA